MLTKKQRNRIYKLALQDLKHRNLVSFSTYSTCDALTRSYNKVYKNHIFYHSVKYSFPEFYLFEPCKDDERDGIFWWNRYHFEERETCLLFCIEMTK